MAIPVVSSVPNIEATSGEQVNKREFLTGAVATALAPTVAAAFPSLSEGYPQISIPEFSFSAMKRAVPKDGKWYQVVCRQDGMVASAYVKQPGSSVAYVYGTHRSE